MMMKFKEWAGSLSQPLRRMGATASAFKMLADDDVAAFRSFLASDPKAEWFRKSPGRAMRAAIEAGAPECCASLQFAGVELDGACAKTRGLSALDYAAKLGRSPCVASLIKAGAKGARAGSALASAVEGGDEACLRAIMAMPSTLVNERGVDGSTALMLAAERGWLWGLRILAPESRPWMVDNFGMTALARAAKSGKLDCLLELLPSSEVDALDNGGRNAMFIAAARGRIDCVYALIGDSKLVKDANGRTAVDALVNAGHRDAAAKVLEHMQGRIEAKLARLAEVRGGIERSKAASVDHWSKVLRGRGSPPPARRG